MSSRESAFFASPADGSGMDGRRHFVEHEREKEDKTTNTNEQESKTKKKSNAQPSSYSETRPSAAVLLGAVSQRHFPRPEALSAASRSGTASLAAMSERTVKLKWNYDGGHWENELGERTDEMGRLTRPRGNRGGKYKWPSSQWSASGSQEDGGYWSSYPQAFHFSVLNGCFRILQK